MAIKRLSNWVNAFHHFHRANRNTPFAWGKWDCCLSAASAVAAITGVDIAADFRDKYTDEASAMQTMKDVTGGTSIEEAVVWCASKYELPEHEYPLTAKRGDLVIVNNNDGNLIAGVIHLNGRHVLAVGPKGYLMLSVSQVVRSWKV